ncbi:MAG TPA: aspartate kinase [Chitinophagaceae bacterium]|nr:aspartate kinase [Chitinophagaceae bacterium]
MKVFKFGGASVSTADGIKNVGSILNTYTGDKLLVVISAMGKTTNALENVVASFYEGDIEKALELFNEIKQTHLTIAADLESEPLVPLEDFFTEIEWLLYDKPVKTFDYYYDQIVCVGELLSTAIISNYLNSRGIKNYWIDVRDVLRTDANYRDATVDWDFTQHKVNEVVEPLFKTDNFLITQGFIGATDENQSTTLGREGSDYTAAIFANMLQVESQTIWKDVEGVMNADPKEWNKAEFIPKLNYREVIEMAYYGAQVIHPKTIKPLQNKNIPLFVRSFINTTSSGTEIQDKHIANLPPIIVYKKNQVLIQLSSKDYSFVGEGLTAEVYRIFDRLKFKPNLTQNAAISMLCVVDAHPQKVQEFAAEAALHFDVEVSKNLLLLTVRHYKDTLLEELCSKSKVLLKQQTPDTTQVLLDAIQ